MIELSQTLAYLDANEDIISLSSSIQSECTDASRVYDIISEIEPKVSTSVNDRFNDKLPFYCLFLSYAYHAISDWSQAKQFAERAIQQFNINGQRQNEAISKWFLGLLLCPYEDFDQAQTEVNQAYDLIVKLDNKLRRGGEYEIPQKYQYADIYKNIRESYSSVEKQVLNGLARIKRAPTIPQEFFSRIIEQLSIPEELLYLEEDWIADLIHASTPLDDRPIADKLSKILNQIQDENNESILTRILLAHRNNLDYYVERQQGYQVETLMKEAIGINQRDNINQYLSHSYLSLLDYNQDVNGKGRLHLENACRCLDKSQQEYKRQGFIENSQKIQHLQKDIRSWFLRFEFDSTSNRIMGPLTQRPEKFLDNAASKQKRKNPIGWIAQVSRNIRPANRSKSESSAPEKTPSASNETIYRNTSIQIPKLKSNRTQPPDQMGPPTTPRTPPTEGANQSNIRLLVVPVDMNILGQAETYDSPVSHDLFEKLETFDNKYVNLKGNSHPGFSKKTAQPRIIIPSYPIRRQATANPKGEAELPSMDGSQSDLASAVDETMKLKIQNHTYEVFIKQGITEIKGSSYNWFQVEGNSMDNAEPIPIENEDFVLIHKKSCNPKLCDGKIVLASVRDNNIDPTRLMVKRFVFMSPKRQPGLEITTPLLLSESRSRIKEIVLTEEYQIEGEVVAIAKLIDE